MVIAIVALSSTISKDICFKNMHDLDLLNGSMSNLDMPIELSYISYYLMEIADSHFTIYIIISKILAVQNVYNLEPNFYNKSRSNKPNESQYMTCYFTEIIFYTISLPISKIFTV